MCVRKVSKCKLRLALLATEVGVRNSAAEAGVSARSSGQDHQMLPFWIGKPVWSFGGTEREFSTKYCWQAHFARGLSELHHPVKTVMVQEGKTAELESGRLSNHLSR